MDASILTERLHDVKAVGPGRWIARCPAHEDSSPSLSVAERDDRILVHCFAGCPLEDICEALGVFVGELFATKQAADRSRTGLTPSERLELLQHEATVVLMITEKIVQRGCRPVSGETDRLLVACDRIYALKR